MEDNFHVVSRTTTGTVNAKRFGKITSTGLLDECDTAGEKVWGVTDGALGTSLSDGVRGSLIVSGFPIEVECSGTVTAGEYVQTDASGKAVTQTTGEAAGYALTTATGNIVEIVPLWGSSGHSVISIPITLAQLANGDTVTNFTPGFSGTFQRIAFAVTVPATTAAKAATLNLEIGNPGTNVTAGTLALTSANCTPLGAVVAAAAITAANRFSASDVISVEAASVTTFIEGSGVLFITIATP